MKYGYIPSPKTKVGLGHPHHLLGATTIPYAGEALLPLPVDQGNTSSCVANSSAVAVSAAMGRALVPQGGLFPELPSRLFIYYLARAESGDQDRDSGTYVHAAFEAMATFGYCPESVYRFTDDTVVVNSMPPWQAFRKAADQKYTKGAYRINEDGDLVDNIKRAIAAGHAVVWGTDLDMAFEDLARGHVWPGVTGQVIGGHAMVLHKYEGDVFWTRSSWGSNFCEDGSARVSASAVAAGSDFWVVANAPEYSE